MGKKPDKTGKKPNKKGVDLDKYTTKLVSNISCGALLGAVPFAVLFFLLTNPIFIILAIAVASAGVIADGVVFAKTKIEKARKEREEKLIKQKQNVNQVSPQKEQEECQTKEAEWFTSSETETYSNHSQKEEKKEPAPENCPEV